MFIDYYETTYSSTKPSCWHKYSCKGETDITIAITVDGNKTTIDHDLDGDGVAEIKTYSEDSNDDGNVDITRTTVCAKPAPT